MKRSSLPNWIPSYLILFFTLALAVSIAFVKERSWIFMALLALDVVFCVMNRKYFSHSMVVVVRTLFALVFIFSSLSKGVDPLGTQYVIHDYLEAYDLPWLTGLSLFGSFLLNLVEFMVGVLLLFNIRFKYTVWFAGLMMAFFTVVTFFDAVAEPVPDCGCFGKALVITNWQTFYKNIILDAFVLVLLFSCSRIGSRKPKWVAWTISLAAMLFFLGFEYYNYRYLPVVNFLDWKEGVRLFPENPEPVRHYLTYRDKQTGEETEYLMEECPFGDPAWMENHEFVSRRDFDPNPRTANINILEKMDEEDPGYDITRSLLEQERPLILVAVHDLEAADSKGVEKTAAFVRKAREAGYECCFLTASAMAQAEAFKVLYGLEDFPFYFADDTAVKAVIRSNPGIVLIKDAYVLNLWDWRRLPAFEEVVPASR